MGDIDDTVIQDRDPFYDPPSSVELLGTVDVFLRSLAYLVELDEHLPIVDLCGQEQGQLAVALVPCNTAGKEIPGEFVQDSSELVR